MRIDAYSFGVMKVAGREYKLDLIVFPEKVVSNWRRIEGHSLAMEDLQEVVEFKPDVLIVGTGAEGLMAVPELVEKLLREKGIVMISVDTDRAWKIYNEQIKKNSKVVGAFHLTC